MKRELCRWSKVAFSKILRNNSRMVDPTNLFSQMCDHQHMCGIWGKSGQASSSEADFTILSRHVSSSSSVWLNVEILITSVERHRSATLLELSRASCLVMTVVILGRCICKFVEHGRHCAFNVVHIGKDRALGPDGENTSASTAPRAPLSCACGTMVSWSNEQRGRIRPATLATLTTIAFRA